MRSSRFSLLAVLTAMFLAACGDDVTKVTNMMTKSSAIEVVESAYSLGKCSDKISGEMKFAAKEGAVFVCADFAWKNVSAMGKDGSSCIAEPLEDSSGYKVVCDGDSVGVVKNGSNGNGCSLIDNGETVSQICDADTITWYKAFCGGSAYDPEKAFCFENSLYSCGGKSYDISKEFCDSRDSRIYKFTVIGSQTWMAENVRFELGACMNDLDSCAKFGRLYTKRESENVCPGGWHLPTTDEWNVLIDYVDKSSGDDSVGLSLKSQTGWDEGANGLDEFGFNALPAGKFENHALADVGKSAGFWIAGNYCTGVSAGIGMGKYNFVSLQANHSLLFEAKSATAETVCVKNFTPAYSVRCIKD